MKSIIALALFVAVANAQFPQFGSANKAQAFPKLQFAQLAPKPAFQKYNPVAVVAKPVLTKYNPLPVVAKPVEYQHHASDASAPILKLVSDVSATGFNYAYETGNGIAAQAQGSLKSVGTESSLDVQGSYQYQSPEGVPVLVSYVADENGYQPQSDILPTPHPIPEAILRSLEYIRTHAPKEQQKY